MPCLLPARTAGLHRLMSAEGVLTMRSWRRGEWRSVVPAGWLRPALTRCLQQLVVDSGSQGGCPKPCAISS